MKLANRTKFVEYRQRDKLFASIRVMLAFIALPLIMPLAPHFALTLPLVTSFDFIVSSIRLSLAKTTFKIPGLASSLLRNLVRVAYVGSVVVLYLDTLA